MSGSRWTRRAAATLAGVAVVWGAACGGGEPEAEEVPYIPPGPPAQDTLSQGTLEGLDTEELGLTLPWTSGALNRRPAPGAPSRTIEGIELSGGEGFDRLVISFAADARDFPGYRLEYLDAPPTDCAADPAEAPVATSGAAFLRVRILGARGHDDTGRSTVGSASRKGTSDHLLTLVRTCDFEGEVTWVFDLTEATPYRILELSSPDRLVVDVQRPA